MMAHTMWNNDVFIIKGELKSRRAANLYTAVRVFIYRSVGPVSCMFAHASYPHPVCL